MDFESPHLEIAGDLTLLLNRIAHGDRSAQDEFLTTVYHQLRRIAGHQFGLEHSGHTLQPTAVVHELYFRILQRSPVNWQSREHFFSVASQTIRRILVDHARAKNAKRRAHRKVSIDEVYLYSEETSEDILALNEALEELERHDERAARIVDMRFWGGLDTRTIASIVGTSERTVKREWSFARAWLSRFLDGRAAAKDSDE